MNPISLEARRLIRATPARLFAAWTQPELLVQWWGPDGVTCTGAEVDLRPGGLYRIDNQLPDGSVIRISGEFVQVEPPLKLVYTWQTNPNTPFELVSVEFIPQGEHTEVVIVHERIPRQELADQHENGWFGCLQGLKNFVDSGAS